MFKTYQHKSQAAADETLNQLLDLIVEGTWDWNGNTGHVDRNPGWYRMLGYEVGIFLKDVFTWENIIHPDDYARVMEHFELYIQGKIDTYCIEYRCRKANGEYLWIVDRGKVLQYNADGTVARMIGAHQNIHTQKLAEKELKKHNQCIEEGDVTLKDMINLSTQELKSKNQVLKEKVSVAEYASNTDPLTNIANRRKLESELSKEIKRSNRYNHPLTLALFDIDHFKRINDTFGHRVGDTVLQGLVVFISQHIRVVDLFARWGGDEFVLIFPNLNLEKALLVAEKLRALIGEFEAQQSLSISCSFGVTEYAEEESIEAFFQRADKLLYQAKAKGRNRVESQL